MKKRIISLFSPRKLIVWVSIFVIALGLQYITGPSMSQTEALVQLLCIDKTGQTYEIATNVLTPSQDKSFNNQTYSAEGKSLSEAISNLSVTIGKDIGLAQCEVVALGEGVCAENVLNTLDFLTRTKKIERNAMLINFDGKVDEFAKSFASISKDKSLKIENIIRHNELTSPWQDSNIESFYRGYFCKSCTSLMPYFKSTKEQQPFAIEASSSTSSRGGQSATTSGQDKNYIVIDGSVSVFKNGTKFATLDKELSSKTNIFLNKNQQGSFTVEHVNDDLFEDATITFEISYKSASFKPSFDKNTPKFKVEVSYAVLIEEVIDKNIDYKHLQRNKNFITNKALEALKSKIKSDMEDVKNYSIENEVDLMNAYKYFEAYCKKDFGKYYDNLQKKYLNNIDYTFEVQVSSSY